MVHIHKVGGNAKTSYGIYVNKGLIEDAGWNNGDSLRLTVVNPDLILVTSEHLPTEQWVELYNAATAGKTIDELAPAEFIQLFDVTDGEDGRRPSSVTSLAPLGGSGHRILVTNAVNSLDLSVGMNVSRRAELDIVVLSVTKKETEDTKDRVDAILNTRVSQMPG